jgi:hypothetical protein
VIAAHDLPLRWGSRRTRAAWGGILIISGAVAVAGSNSVSVPWLLVPGVLAHIAGWCIMPAAGSRRILAAVLSTPAAVLLITGPQFIAVMVLPYLAWLIVRHRPARSYPTILFVLAGGVILPRLFPDYSGMLPALGIEIAIMVGSALAARAVAVAGPDSRTSRRPPELPS